MLDFAILKKKKKNLLFTSVFYPLKKSQSSFKEEIDFFAQIHKLCLEQTYVYVYITNVSYKKGNILRS